MALIDLLGQLLLTGIQMMASSSGGGGGSFPAMKGSLDAAGNFLPATTSAIGSGATMPKISGGIPQGIGLGKAGGLGQVFGGGAPPAQSLAQSIVQPVSQAINTAQKPLSGVMDAIQQSGGAIANTIMPTAEAMTPDTGINITPANVAQQSLSNNIAPSAQQRIGPQLATGVFKDRLNNAGNYILNLADSTRALSPMKTADSLALQDTSLPIPERPIPNGAAEAASNVSPPVSNEKPILSKSTGKNSLKRYIAETARKHGVDPSLALAVAEQESKFNPKARSSAGAQGIFQLMPGTAKHLGVNPADTNQNIEGGIRYLKQMKNMTGTDEGALISYNAGPGNYRSGKWKKFKETRDYVKRIQKLREKYRNY